MTQLYDRVERHGTRISSTCTAVPSVCFVLSSTPWIAAFEVHRLVRNTQVAGAKSRDWKIPLFAMRGHDYSTPPTSNFPFDHDVQILTSFEGELQGQDDLLALISGSGFDMFDWSAGADIGSTFHPQVRIACDPVLVVQGWNIRRQAGVVDGDSQLDEEKCFGTPVHPRIACPEDQAGTDWSPGPSPYSKRFPHHRTRRPIFRWRMPYHALLRHSVLCSCALLHP